MNGPPFQLIDLVAPPGHSTELEILVQSVAGDFSDIRKA